MNSSLPLWARAFSFLHAQWCKQITLYSGLHNLNWCMLGTQVAPSRATSLLGQQSLSSLASPSTPLQATSHSIFASTQRRSELAPPPPSAPESAMTHESQAAALSSEEQESAQKLGFGEGPLAPSSRRMLQAHVLQQEIRSTKVVIVFT